MQTNNPTNDERKVITEEDRAVLRGLAEELNRSEEQRRAQPVTRGEMEDYIKEIFERIKL